MYVFCYITSNLVVKNDIKYVKIGLIGSNLLNQSFEV